MINSMHLLQAAGPDCIVFQFETNSINVITPSLLKILNQKHNTPVFPVRLEKGNCNINSKER